MVYNYYNEVTMSNHFVENYENLSDERLINLCRNGDESAFSEIVTRYLPMVCSRVSSVLKCFPKEYDDFVQEGLIALLSAINSFDYKSSSFSTFARLCVDRALIGIIRKENAKSKIPNSLFIGFEEQIVDEPNTPESLVLEREKVKELYSRLRSDLSQFEFSVLNQYLTGLSHKEISEKLSVDTKAVNNAITRIRRKLKISD